LLKKILAIAALVFAVLAFFSVHAGKLTTARELTLAVGLLAVAALI
jgi:hypothetical protein